jgi:hypothetical protein
MSVLPRRTVRAISPEQASQKVKHGHLPPASTIAGIKLEAELVLTLTSTGLATARAGWPIPAVPGWLRQPRQYDLQRSAPRSATSATMARNWSRRSRTSSPADPAGRVWPPLGQIPRKPSVAGPAGSGVLRSHCSLGIPPHRSTGPATGTSGGVTSAASAPVAACERPGRRRAGRRRTDARPRPCR